MKMLISKYAPLNINVYMLCKALFHISLIGLDEGSCNVQGCYEYYINWFIVRRVIRLCLLSLK